MGLNIHCAKSQACREGRIIRIVFSTYRGSSFTLFVNFACFHLLGWILFTKRRLLLTASYVGRIYSFIHLQTTTPTPTVTIQLLIISLYRTFHFPTRGYIHHRKSGISSLLPSYPFLLKKRNQSKWQPVCYDAVVPHPHVIAEYPYRGIEYPYFRRNSRFRRYQSGRVPVCVLRGHTARVSRICTTTIMSIPFPLSFSIDVLNDIRHQTNYYSSRQPLPPTWASSTDEALPLYDISTSSSHNSSHSRKHREQVTSASYDRVVSLWDMRSRLFDGNKKEKE